MTETPAAPPLLAMAMTTAPRPRETLQLALSSLHHAGWRERLLLLADYPAGERITLPNLCPPLTLVQNDPPLGGLKNWCSALQLLVDTTEARWLAILEDDILWAEGAIPALERDLHALQGKSVGYLSLYISRKVSHEIERRKRTDTLTPGLHKSELGAGVWGSQAYVLPRRTAQALLADPEFDDQRRNYVKNRNRDGIVSGALARMGLPLYFRVPALVNHRLGEANSSLRDKPIQPSLQCKYWKGKA